MTRIAKALNSGDLEHHEHPCDVDVLQAAGATAMRKPLGVLLIEAWEGAAGDSPHAAARVRELRSALEHLVRAIARRWRLEVDAPAVSDLIVRELIIDCCNACQGRGFKPIRYDGSSVEAGHVGKTKRADCHVCLGSGRARRDFDARAKAAGHERYSRRLGDWWEAVLQSCAHAEISARSGIAKRLRYKG